MCAILFSYVVKWICCPEIHYKIIPAPLLKHKNRTGYRKCLVFSYFLAYGNKTKAIILHMDAINYSSTSTWDKSALFAVMKI